MPHHVLITGASTGIGRDCALRLASKGFKVYAGVRKTSDYESLRAMENLEPIFLDVLKNDSVSKAVELLEEKVSSGDAFSLMNNAGIVKAGPLEHLPCEDLSFQLETNVTAQIRVSQAFLPLLRASKDGRIIFTGSQSGYFTSPLMGAYCASKHAIEAVADAFRRELELTSKIKVVLLQPGQIKTPIWDKSLEKVEEIQGNIPPASQPFYQNMMDRVLLRAEDASKNGASTEEVVFAVMRALASPKPKTRYRMGKGAKVTYLLNKILSDRGMDYLIKKALKL